MIFLTLDYNDTIFLLPYFPFFHNLDSVDPHSESYHFGFWCKKHPYVLENESPTGI